MNKKWWLAFLAVCLAFPVAAITFVQLSKIPDKQPDVAKTSSETSTKAAPLPPPTKEALFVAVNAERAKNGVAPLLMDDRLNGSAQTKACDEKDNNYFGHISPTTGEHGYMLAERALSPMYGDYSENLTETLPPSVAQAMQHWVSSPVHHAAMIDPKYTLTGFGICGAQFVEHFYGPESS